MLRVIGGERVGCLEWRAAMTDAKGVVHTVQGVNLAETDGDRFVSLRAYFDRKALDIAGDSKV